MTRRAAWFYLFLFPVSCLLIPARSSAQSSIKVVTSPVADVRAKPEISKGMHEYDPLQETQILYGETVVVVRVENGYAWVACPDQMEYTHNSRWEGYPGWVIESALGDPPDGRGLTIGYASARWTPLFDRATGEKTIAVPFGSRLPIIKRGWYWTDVRGADGRTYRVRSCKVRAHRLETDRQKLTRARIWRGAKKFIGTNYFWGGLSPATDERGRGGEGERGRGGERANGRMGEKENSNKSVNGVDCSGLVHTCYRLAGIDLPRDSHEQWMTSARVEPRDLKRGDLVFLAKPEKPDRVVHVMIYAGGEYLIEGPGTGLKVRRITFKKKLGRRLRDLSNGGAAGDRIVYFGRQIGR